MEIRASFARVLLFWLAIAVLAVALAAVLIAPHRGTPYLSTLLHLFTVKLVTVPIFIILVYLFGHGPGLRLAGSYLASVPRGMFSARGSVPAVLALAALERPLTLAERMGHPAIVTAPGGESIAFMPVLYSEADRRLLAKAIRSQSQGPA